MAAKETRSQLPRAEAMKAQGPPAPFLITQGLVSAEPSGHRAGESAEWEARGQDLQRTLHRGSVCSFQGPAEGRLLQMGDNGRLRSATYTVSAPASRFEPFS